MLACGSGCESGSGGADSAACHGRRKRARHQKRHSPLSQQHSSSHLFQGNQLNHLIRANQTDPLNQQYLASPVHGGLLETVVSNSTRFKWKDVHNVFVNLSARIRDVTSDIYERVDFKEFPLFHLTRWTPTTREQLLHALRLCKVMMEIFSTLSIQDGFDPGVRQVVPGKELTNNPMPKAAYHITKIVNTLNSIESKIPMLSSQDYQASQANPEAKKQFLAYRDWHDLGVYCVVHACNMITQMCNRKGVPLQQTLIAAEMLKTSLLTGWYEYKVGEKKVGTSGSTLDAMLIEKGMVTALKNYKSSEQCMNNVKVIFSRAFAVCSVKGDPSFEDSAALIVSDSADPENEQDMRMVQDAHRVKVSIEEECREAEKTFVKAEERRVVEEAQRQQKEEEQRQEEERKALEKKEKRRQEKEEAARKQELQEVSYQYNEQRREFKNVWTQSCNQVKQSLNTLKDKTIEVIGKQFDIQIQECSKNMQGLRERMDAIDQTLQNLEKQKKENTITGDEYYEQKNSEKIELELLKGQLTETKSKLDSCRKAQKQTQKSMENTYDSMYENVFQNKVKKIYRIGDYFQVASEKLALDIKKQEQQMSSLSDGSGLKDNARERIEAAEKLLSRSEQKFKSVRESIKEILQNECIFLKKCESELESLLLELFATSSDTNEELENIWKHPDTVINKHRESLEKCAESALNANRDLLEWEEKFTEARMHLMSETEDVTSNPAQLSSRFPTFFASHDDGDGEAEPVPDLNPAIRERDRVMALWFDTSPSFKERMFAFVTDFDNAVNADEAIQRRRQAGKADAYKKPEYNRIRRPEMHRSTTVTTRDEPQTTKGYSVEEEREDTREESDVDWKRMRGIEYYQKNQNMSREDAEKAFEQDQADKAEKEAKRLEEAHLRKEENLRRQAQQQEEAAERKRLKREQREWENSQKNTAKHSKKKPSSDGHVSREHTHDHKASANDMHEKTKKQSNVDCVHRRRKGMLRYWKQFLFAQNNESDPVQQLKSKSVQAHAMAMVNFCIFEMDSAALESLLTTFPTLEHKHWDDSQHMKLFEIINQEVKSRLNVHTMWQRGRNILQQFVDLENKDTYRIGFLVAELKRGLCRPPVNNFKKDCLFWEELHFKNRRLYEELHREFENCNSVRPGQSQSGLYESLAKALAETHSKTPAKTPAQTPQQTKTKSPDPAASQNPEKIQPESRHETSKPKRGWEKVPQQTVASPAQRLVDAHFPCLSNLAAAMPNGRIHGVFATALGRGLRAGWDSQKMTVFQAGDVGGGGRGRKTAAIYGIWDKKSSDPHYITDDESYKNSLVSMYDAAVIRENDVREAQELYDSFCENHRRTYLDIIDDRATIEDDYAYYIGVDKQLIAVYHILEGLFYSPAVELFMRHKTQNQGLPEFVWSLFDGRVHAVKYEYDTCLQDIETLDDIVHRFSDLLQRLFSRHLKYTFVSLVNANTDIGQLRLYDTRNVPNWYTPIAWNYDYIEFVRYLKGFKEIWPKENDSQSQSLIWNTAFSRISNWTTKLPPDDPDKEMQVHRLNALKRVQETESSACTKIMQVLCDAMLRTLILVSQFSKHVECSEAAILLPYLKHEFYQGQGDIFKVFAEWFDQCFRRTQGPARPTMRDPNGEAKRDPDWRNNEGRIMHHLLRAPITAEWILRVAEDPENFTMVGRSRILEVRSRELPVGGGGSAPVNRNPIQREKGQQTVELGLTELGQLRDYFESELHAVSLHLPA